VRSVRATGQRQFQSLNVPAKRKLIEVNLKKAAAATRDVLTDFLAKYFAELSKP